MNIMKSLVCLTLLVGPIGCSTVKTLPPITTDPVCICTDGHDDACPACSPKHSHEDGNEHSHEEE